MNIIVLTLLDQTGAGKVRYLHHLILGLVVLVDQMSAGNPSKTIFKKEKSKYYINSYLLNLNYIKINISYRYANVRIYITNEGSNAIPDYNKIIIIERRITQTASSIVLKTISHIGGREEIKSKKTSRIDLDLILQQFNIDLDNPLSWLSQDRARQFLQSMKPERLYEVKEFFLNNILPNDKRNLPP